MRITNQQYVHRFSDYTGRRSMIISVDLNFEKNELPFNMNPNDIVSEFQAYLEQRERNLRNTIYDMRPIIAFDNKEKPITPMAPNVTIIEKFEKTVKNEKTDFDAFSGIELES